MINRISGLQIGCPACVTRDCTFGVLVLPIFQRRVPVSASYIVTFISTKDIGVLGTAPWRISMRNFSGIRVINFIVINHCECNM